MQDQFELLGKLYARQMHGIIYTRKQSRKQREAQRKLTK
jgi:hypothetical protein